MLYGTVVQRSGYYLTLILYGSYSEMCSIPGAHPLPKVSSWRHISCPKSQRGGTSPVHSLCVEAHLLPKVSKWRHISCPQSLRRGTSPAQSVNVEAHLLPKVSSTRTFLNLSPSKTCYQLCSETEMFAGKSSLQLRF